MNQNTIAKINGVDIATVTDENGNVFVPVKPICDAIGVAYQSQQLKLQEHELLAPTITLRVIVAADGKQREMVCLPLEYVYGWIFTINPKNVSGVAHDAVLRYQLECYKVLYEHFAGSMRRTIETNNAEIELLQQINSAISDEKDAKCRRKKAEDALNKLRSDRLNPQPSLFS